MPADIRTLAIAKINVGNHQYADKLNGKNAPHPESEAKKTVSLMSTVDYLDF